MRRFAVLFALFSSVAFASVPARFSATNPRPTQFPIWRIERNQNVSYIVGTPPFDFDARALSPIYRELIRSSPNFLTDIGEIRPDTDLVEEFLDSSAREGFIYENLTREQMKFVRGIFRRLALTKTPRWKQIFIPGYAGLLAEGAAFASGVVPPAIVASAVISASTGLGLGPGPSAEDVLLKIAKEEHRKISMLPMGVDFPFLVRAIDTRQLKDLLEYVQFEMKYGHPVDLVSAFEKLFESADAQKLQALDARIRESLDDTVLKIVNAHMSGGAVVSLNLMQLVDSSTRNDFFKQLENQGFKVTLFNSNTNGDRSPSCSRLLGG